MTTQKKRPGPAYRLTELQLGLSLWAVTEGNWTLDQASRAFNISKNTLWALKNDPGNSRFRGVDPIPVVPDNPLHWAQLPPDAKPWKPAKQVD